MFDGPISLFYNRCCFGSDFFLPRLGLNCEDVRFIRGYIGKATVEVKPILLENKIKGQYKWMQGENSANVEGTG